MPAKSYASFVRESHAAAFLVECQRRFPGRPFTTSVDEWFRYIVVTRNGDKWARVGKIPGWRYRKPPQYPTSLDKIARGGVFHLYSEWRGLRYYLGSFTTYPAACEASRFYQQNFWSAGLYISDKTGSTSINGGLTEFQQSYGLK